MAELADALDLGSSGNTRAGSTPVTRINKKSRMINILLFLLPRRVIEPEVTYLGSRLGPRWTVATGD